MKREKEIFNNNRYLFEILGFSDNKLLDKDFNFSSQSTAILNKKSDLDLVLNKLFLIKNNLFKNLKNLKLLLNSSLETNKRTAIINLVELGDMIIFDIVKILNKEKLYDLEFYYQIFNLLKEFNNDLDNLKL